MKRETPSDGFRDALIEGLQRRPRRVPCRYLYDSEGAMLFDRITDLPEYYLTRTEMNLLTRHGRDIADTIGPGAKLVEFGAGSMRKTRRLLDALDEPAAYLPIDISREALLLCARRLATEYPTLAIEPLVADFMRPVTLPPVGDGGAPLAFFPGSTIGNFEPTEARDFLRRTARLVGPGGWLLVGVDLVKDRTTLEAAYDDSAGLTTSFIRNLLARANRELTADFDLEGFDHTARWNAREGRVEIHLIANRRQKVQVAGHVFHFRTGDTIHVEDCYKYSIEQFHWLARQGGFEPCEVWSDSDGLFSLHLLTAA